MPKISGNLSARALPPIEGTKTLLPYVKTYHRAYAAARITRTLKNLVSQWTGPVYIGEAERLFFDPILAMAKQVNSDGLTPGSIIKQAYVEAIDWAFITEYITLTQPKYLAQQLTMDSIKQQPLFEAIQKLKDSKNIIVIKGQGPTSAEDDLKELRKLLSADSLQTLAFMYNLQDPMSLGAGTTATLEMKWDNIQKYTNKGKGAVRDQTQRQSILQQRAEVVAAIIKCLGPAQEGVSGDLFADGLALTILFLTYLKSVEDYDAGWPKQPYQSVPAAWLMSLSSQASNLSGLWMKAATSPAYYDFYACYKVFENVLELFDPIIKDYIDWAEMKRIYLDQTKATIAAVPDVYKQFVDKAFANQKAYGQADALIPELPDPLNVFWKAMSQVSQEFAKVSLQSTTVLKDDDTWDIQGFPVLAPQQLDSLREWTQFASVPWKYGRAYVTALSTMAQSIINAADAIHQVATIAEQAYGDALAIAPRWSVDEQDWIELPINGNLTTGSDPSFEEMDPMSRIKLRWLYDYSKADKWKWIYKDLMYQMVDIPALEREVTVKNIDFPIWPAQRTIPAGDLITSPYTDAVIPYNYTVGRRRQWNKYSLTNWRSLMTTPDRPFSMKDFFDNATTTIATLPLEHAKAVADAMAANFTIVIQEGELPESDRFQEVNVDSVKWGQPRILHPTLPSIWGMPYVTYRRLNKLILSIAAPDKHHPFGAMEVGDLTSEADLIAAVEADFAYKADYVNSFGGQPLRAYFCLRSLYPTPSSATPVMWSPRKGMFLGVMLRDDALNAVKLEDIKSLLTDTTTGMVMSVLPYAGWNSSKQADVLSEAQFQPPMGWSDLVIPWGHISMDASPQSSDHLELSWASFIGNKVSMYQDPITRDFRMRASAQIQPYLLDYDDFLSAKSITDPSISLHSKEAAPAPTDPDRVNDDVIGGIHDVKAKPDSVAPADHEITSEELASVVASPVLGQSGGTVSIHSTDTASADATLSGEPTSGSDTIAITASTPDERYWKKVTHGEITDVVKSPECPKGYIPASEQEFRDFTEHNNK